MAFLRQLAGFAGPAGSSLAWISNSCCAPAGAAVLGTRLMSGIGGQHNPMDITRNNNPQLHQENGINSEAETAAFEMKVPGVAAFSEPGIPKPGTVQPPNPSPQLLEKVPIAKVTHDGDVTAQSIPAAPHGDQPRN